MNPSPLPRLLRRFFLLVGIYFCLTGSTRVHADLGANWEWRNPLPQGSGIKAMAESGGKLIAVGRSGAVITSTDGMTWTPRAPATRSILRAVAAWGATVVAVGREGTIVTSTDGGLTWTQRFTGFSDWHTVTHGSGMWVVAGESSTVMTSPDGLTWTPALIPDSSLTVFEFAVWTGTRFVLAGFNYVTTDTSFATSEDGTTWTVRLIADLARVTGLTWSGSRLVAVGSTTVERADSRILFSVDGIVWTNVVAPNNAGYVLGVLWTGTRVFAWGSKSFISATAGSTWTVNEFNMPPPLNDPTVRAAGSGSQLVIGASRGVMLSSGDEGATWTSAPSGVAGECNALIHFAGRWVAAGTDGNLTSSADGLTWMPASSGTISRLRAIAWHEGLWVAGGGEEFAPPGLPEPRKYSIFTSADGVTWTDRSFGSPEAPGLRQIYGVIHAGTQWVATASGAVLTSPDGVHWQEHPVGLENRAAAWNGSRLMVVGGKEHIDSEGQGVSYFSDDGGTTWHDWALGPYFLRSVTWTGSQFVAVGDLGRVCISPTGTQDTWTVFNLSSDDLRGIVSDGGKLVVVGGASSSSPMVATSADGLIWTKRAAPGTQALYGICKAGGVYAAAGYDGTLLTSPDAVTWTARQTNTTHELYAAAWDGTQLLVSGEGGAILASENTFIEWKSIMRHPGSGLAVRLTWPTVAGRVYDIESSTTLTAPWLPVPGSPRTAGGVEAFIDFVEPAPSPVTKRFFRVQERP